jgi:hypothetical protein
MIYDVRLQWALRLSVENGRFDSFEEERKIVEVK